MRFVDGNDDYVMSDYIEYMLENIIKQEADIALTTCMCSLLSIKPDIMGSFYDMRVFTRVKQEYPVMYERGLNVAKRGALIVLWIPTLKK